MKQGKARRVVGARIVAAHVVAIAGCLASVVAASRPRGDVIASAPSLSRQTAAATGTTVNIAGAPAKGARSARVAVVEYADFECPYCGAFFRETLPTLDREYVRTGKVLLVFKHRPLPTLHPNAVTAASGAECAGEQGSFWPMHDLLFADQKNLSMPGLLTRVTRLALDSSSFTSCMELDRGKARVNADMAAASALQITGTPTFLIGTVDRRTNVVQVRERLEGAKPMAVLQPVLDRLLAEAK